MLVFALESLMHPQGYDPLRHTVSAFALGPFGWVQRTSFIASGLLITLSVGGLRVAWARHGGRALVPVLVGLLGLGLIGSGLAAADPVAAGVTADAPYPPGEPFTAARTLTGVLHDLCGTPVFLGLPILTFAAARRFLRSRRSGWAVYSLVTATTFLAGFVLTSLALAQPPVIAPLGGLLQRLTLAVGLSWLVALLLHLRRNLPDGAAA